MARNLYGIVVPFATPFTPDEELDTARAKVLIDNLIDAGIQALIILGDTGEFFTLTPDERLQFTEATFKYIDGRVPVIIQPSAMTTREAVQYAKHAESLGADALMLLPPYYRSSTSDEVYAHYAAVAESADLPIICYCLPGISTEVMTPEFIAKLAEIDSISYLKDSTGILSRIREIKDACGDRISVFVGGDSIAYDGLVAGAVGSIWGAANFMPRQAVQLYELVCQEADLIKACELWEKIFPICSFLEKNNYAASVKAALALVGLNMGPARRPALPLGPEKLEDLAERLRGLGLPVRQG
jgi:4-hydroxy-tetrahydrodipicolinate synthase